MIPNFIGPSYNLRNRRASLQRTVNMVPVPLEPGNERSAWAFKDVPGLAQFALVPPPPNPDNPIQYIGAAWVAGPTGGNFVPPYQEGDLIFSLTRRVSGSDLNPEPRNGIWITPPDGLFPGSAFIRFRAEYFYATEDSSTTPFTTDFEQLSFCVVYRGASLGAITSAPVSMVSSASAPSLAAATEAVFLYSAYVTTASASVTETGPIVLRSTKPAPLGDREWKVYDSDTLSEDSPDVGFAFGVPTAGGLAVVELIPDYT